MKVTARNCVDSPLLRLPGELRNLIYGYASVRYIIRIRLRSYRPLELEYSAIPAPFKLDDGHNLGSCPPSSVLPAGCIFNLSRICSQIRNVTRHIDHYACSLFAFDHILAYGTFFHLRLRQHQRTEIRTIALFDTDKFIESSKGPRANCSVPALMQEMGAFRNLLPNLERVLVDPKTWYLEAMMEQFEAAGLLIENSLRDTGLQMIEPDELSLDIVDNDYELGGEKKRIVI